MVAEMRSPRRQRQLGAVGRGSGGGEFLLRAVEIAYREQRHDGARPFYTNAEILEHIERLVGLMRERMDNGDGA